MNNLMYMETILLFKQESLHTSRWSDQDCSETMFCGIAVAADSKKKKPDIDFIHWQIDL